MHKDAVGMETSRESITRHGGIEASFQRTVTLQKQAVMGAMKCMYWLVKEEVAHTTKFASLLDLVIDLGCSYMKELNVGGNAHYTSERIMNEFVRALSMCIEDDLKGKIAASPYVSLLCDESTDVSTVKQLVIYIRIIHDGKPETHFLQLREIANGTAETVTSALLASCCEYNIDISKVMGFGSDGAAVMVGEKSGVSTRLKEANSKLVSVHCAAHRLSLATSQSADAIPQLKRMKSIINAIYKFYHLSCVRTAALTEIQSVLCDPLLKFRQVIDIRWLSHDNAIQAVRQCLKSLLASLEYEVEENADPTALDLVKSIKSYSFIACVYLLSDILPQLSKLSLVFQQVSIDFSMIRPIVFATITTLESFKITPGYHLRQLDDVFANELSEYNIIPTAQEKQSFNTLKVEYIKCLVANLKRRFLDVPVLAAFQIFMPNKVPDIESDAFAGYGAEELHILLDHYSPDVVSAEACEQEWLQFRIVMANSCSSMTTAENIEALLTNSTLNSMYPNLAILGSIAMSIPLSTADC